METEETQTTMKERVGCLQFLFMAIVFLLALGNHQRSTADDMDENTDDVA